MDWYVYILSDERSRTHVGITQDIEFATFTHWRGRKAPESCRLVYYERLPSEREARTRHRELSRPSPRRRKRLLQELNPYGVDLSLVWMTIFTSSPLPGNDEEGGVAARPYDPKIGPIRPRADAEAQPIPVEWEPTLALHA